jgi:L-ascorbate metabolism protein UlaG (beta-lactamase superfamily)
MKITKYGHCCLLVEEKGLRLITDPGNYSNYPNGKDELENIDLVLITHEHADHIHIPALKEIVKKNPSVRIVTNKGVAKLLDVENIKYELIENNGSIVVKGILIEGLEGKHELIYKTLPSVQNTGFFINNKLFYPGDSFHNPNKKVDILALPVAGPWCRISDAIDYALLVKPRVAFPVHDGGLKIMGANHRIPSMVLPNNGIQFVVLEEGKETEL